MHAFGLPHAPLGQAQLNESGGTLTVSNIGSSGKDGVSIDLGACDGFECEVDFGPRLQLPPGMLYQIDAFSPIPGSGFGQDQKTLCAQFQEANGGLAALSLDLGALDPGMLRVEVELGGQILQTHEFPQPFPTPILIGELGTSSDGRHGTLTISNIGSSGKDGVSTDCQFCVDSFFDVEYLTPFQVSVAGGGVVIADAVRFTLLQMPAGSLPAPPFTRVEMRGAHTGGGNQFTLTDEALGLFGTTHRAIGTAHMSTGGGTLTVSNIGSSGKDGVSQDPLPPGTPRSVFQLADIQTSVPSVLSVTSLLALDGLPPGTPVTGFIYQDGANPMEFVTDFAPMGSPTQTLELYLAGELIFVQSGMSGVLSSAASPPDNVGVIVENGEVIQVYSWIVPTAITVSGGPTILSDEMHVSPDGGGGLGLPTAQEIIASEIRVAGDDSIVIVNQQVLPPPPACPWDCGDQDGNVGVVDFLALLAQWGQPGTSCDFDGGGVGVTDFLKMLGSWGACP
jgi:hypothetical protein